MADVAHVIKVDNAINHGESAWGSRWKRETAGRTGISMEVPDKFQPVPMAPSDNIVEYLRMYENQEMRLVKKRGVFDVTVRRELYDDRQKVDLDGAVESVRAGLNQLNGSHPSESNYIKELDIQVDSASGHIINVRIGNDGYWYVFLTEGQNYWQMCVGYWADDPEADKRALQVITSLKRVEDK